MSRILITRPSPSPTPSPSLIPCLSLTMPRPRFQALPTSDDIETQEQWDKFRQCRPSNSSTSSPIRPPSRCQKSSFLDKIISFPFSITFKVRTLVIASCLITYLWLLMFPTPINPVMIAVHIVRTILDGKEPWLTNHQPSDLQWDTRWENGISEHPKPLKEEHSPDNHSHKPPGTPFPSQTPSPSTTLPQVQDKIVPLEVMHPVTPLVPAPRFERPSRAIGLGHEYWQEHEHHFAPTPPPPPAMLTHIPDDPDDVSIAYLLTLHDYDTMIGGNELLNAIYNDKHQYFIHVDAKVPDDQYRDLQRMWERDNVYWSSMRRDAHWGSHEIVLLELELLRMAVQQNRELQEDDAEYFDVDDVDPDDDGTVNHWYSRGPPTSTAIDPFSNSMNYTDGHHSSTSSATIRPTATSARKPFLTASGAKRRPWKFAINLCGATFPLHSQRYIDERLAELPPESNVVLHKFLQKLCTFSESVFGDVTEPCNKSWARCMDEGCTKMSATPGNAVVYKGIQWVILSAPFSNWIMENEDGIVKEWHAFFRDVRASDEMFFPTLLMNSPFKDTALMAERPNTYIHPTHILGSMYHDWELWCRSYVNQRPGNSPCYVGEFDVDDMVNSGFLYGRKMRAGDKVKRLLLEHHRKEEEALLQVDRLKKIQKAKEDRQKDEL